MQPLGGVRVRRAAVLLCCFALCAAAQQEDLYTIYTQAQAAQQAGDYKTASQKYERIVTLRPDMAEAHANLGMLYYLQERYAEAQPSLEKALKLKPGLPGPYFFLGVIAFKQREFKKSLKYLKKAESLDPKNVPIQSYLGYANYALKNHAEAARYFELAALNVDRDQDVFYHLGNAYGHLAMRLFGILQEKYPDAPLSYVARGHYYEAQRNWEAAKVQYTHAATLDPQNARLRERLTYVTSQTGNKAGPPPAGKAGYEPADGSLAMLHNPPAGSEVKSQIIAYQALARELEPKPDSVEKLYNLAEYYQILSYLASLWVVEIDPESYRAHQMKGRYFEAIDKDEDAIREYRRALQLNPHLPNVHFLLGNLFWIRERHEEALPELQAELKVNPNYPPALYEIGDILYTAGKWDEALKYYQQAVRYDPDMAEAHLALERIYTEQGQYDKSLEHLRIVSAMAPGDATPYYRMAITYKKLNQPEAAQKALETFQKLKAQEKNPNKIVGSSPDKPRGKPVQ